MRHDLLRDVDPESRRGREQLGLVGDRRERLRSGKREARRQPVTGREERAQSALGDGYEPIGALPSAALGDCGHEPLRITGGFWRADLASAEARRRGQRQRMRRRNQDPIAGSPEGRTIASALRCSPSVTSTPAVMRPASPDAELEAALLNSAGTLRRGRW